jgi:hypothetical protein
MADTHSSKNCRSACAAHSAYLQLGPNLLRIVHSCCSHTATLQARHEQVLVCMAYQCGVVRPLHMCKYQICFVSEVHLRSCLANVRSAPLDTWQCGNAQDKVTYMLCYCCCLL